MAKQHDLIWQAVSERFSKVHRVEEWLDDNSHKLKWECKTIEEARNEVMEVFRANFKFMERHHDCAGKCEHGEEDCPHL